MEYVLFKQISNINMDQSPTSSTFNEVKRDYQHLMKNRIEKYSVKAQITLINRWKIYLLRRYNLPPVFMI